MVQICETSSRFLLKRKYNYFFNQVYWCRFLIENSIENKSNVVSVSIEIKFHSIE